MTEKDDQVDLALADLAMSAVMTLKIQMQTARAAKDRIAAANSILDRLGYGRTTRAQADTADREIRNALAAVAPNMPKPAELEGADEESGEQQVEHQDQDQEQDQDQDQDQEVVNDSAFTLMVDGEAIVPRSVWDLEGEN